MRKFDLMIALAILAGGGALAVSGRVPKFAVGPLTIGGGAASALKPLFGAAPAPAFRSMRRVEMLDLGDEITDVQTGEHFYTVQEANGWRSVVRDSAVHVMPMPGGATQPGMVLDKVVVGPLDLFQLSMRYTLSGSGSAAADSKVATVSGVVGRLFPLAVGKHLRFRTVEGGSVKAGLLGRSAAEAYEYEFTVTGEEDGYSESTPAVPGPVYVIDVKVKDPTYGEDRHFEVHYAPALGAAVRIRTMGDAPPTDERLVSWEPAR